MARGASTTTVWEMVSQQPLLYAVNFTVKVPGLVYLYIGLGDVVFVLPSPKSHLHWSAPGASPLKFTKVFTQMVEGK